MSTRSPLQPFSLAVALALSLVALTGVGSASASTCTVTDGGSAYPSLQAAVTAAAPADTLTVVGTCVGTTSIAKKLQIQGTGGAVLSGGGTQVVLVVTTAKVSLADLTVEDGYGPFLGPYSGAAGIYSTGDLVLSGVTVTHNTSDQGPGPGVLVRGGSLRARSSTFSGNIGYGDGGAIDATGGSLRIIGSRFVNNSAYVGGAIYASAPMVLRRDYFSGNMAKGEAGAIHAVGQLKVRASTFANNQGSSYGGGIEETSGNLTVRESTFASNYAYYGGAIVLFNGARAHLIADTISGNSATYGGGVFNYDGSQVSLADTIIAANYVQQDDSACGVLLAVPFISRGYNLIDDTGGCTTLRSAPTDLLNVPAQLGAFGPNGGPTRTFVPSATSPAVDAIPLSSCPDTRDQRAVPRPQGPACDIGSVER